MDSEPEFKTLLSHLNSVTTIPREVAGPVMLANGLTLTSAITRLCPKLRCVPFCTVALFPGV